MRGVVGARLHGDDPLPDRRQELVQVENRGGGVGEPQPPQPGEREQRRIHLAGVELAQPCLHVTPDGDHGEVGAATLDQGLPPQEAFTFVLVNIHTDPDETDTELDVMGQVYQAVRRSAGGEDDILVLGDLNVDDQHLGLLGRLDGMRAVIRGLPTNTRQTAQYDNIVFHLPSTVEFTGRGGIYNFQQIHNLSPEQALQVSDHLPVWAEFSAYEGVGPGRVASREAATIRAQ